MQLMQVRPVLRMIVPWFQNMVSECTQYSTVHCIFLREEFSLSSVFTKFLLRFEESNILSGSFDKVNEIDMLSQHSLGEENFLEREISGLYN